MDEHREHDEALLIDFLLARCGAADEADVRRRLEAEADFSRLHENLSRALAALGLLDETPAPAGLAEATAGRIRQAARTAALAAREELAGAGAPSTFSLWELATLAAAAVVLAVIFIPSVRQARRRLQAVQCCSNVGQIGTALVKYANSNKSYLPASGGTDTHWLPVSGRAAASNSAGLFRLIRSGYLRADVFQCPAVEVAQRGASRRAGFAVGTDMTDFPAARFIHYSYQHALGPRGLSLRDPVLKTVAETMGILADSTPIFRGGRFLRDRVRADSSDNHQRTGQNVLYLDTHVEWRPKAFAGVENNNIFLADDTFEYKGDETPRSPTDTFLLPAHPDGD